MSRWLYIALALLTIALGLGVHWHGQILGPALRDISGDALWATMIGWWIGAVAPSVSLSRRSVAALALCFTVEFSQLYHSAALDALRSTTMGQLILGSDFDARDLAAYTVGIAVAVLIEKTIVRRFVHSGRAHLR